MLKSLITYLNLKLDLLNYFDLTRCLVELKDNSEGTRQPVEYISKGNYDVIDWDEFNGVSYWRLRDEITSDRTEEKKYKAGARNNIETTVPLKLVFAVPRAKLTEDDAYSFDRIRQTMVKQFAIDDDVIKTTLQAESVRINVVSANSDAKEVWEEETESTGTFEPKYETVFGSIDVDVVIISKHSCLPTECDDVESDIIRAFDWCGNTAVTVGRLTEAQQTCISDFLCSCADATVENSDGSYTNTVASGGTLVLPDITVTDSDGSTSSVPSVQDVTCSPCQDATVELNGIEVATPASGATVDIPVTQDGSPVGSWNGSAWIVPSCPPSVTVSVALSDDTPKLGQSVTITATATGITPTSYTFYLPQEDGSFETVTQAGNTYAWAVSKYDAFTVTVTATDGSSEGSGSATGTTTGDVDADAFITAHNTATGGTIDATMEANTLGFFLRLKGINTTYNENVFSQLLAANAEIYPMIPDDVSNASISGYSINAIDPTRNATMVGFVAGDATINGLTGGSGKYMIMNNAPSDYGQNDVGIGVYVRTGSNFTVMTGADTLTLAQQFGNPVWKSRLNFGTERNFPLNQFGFVYAQRNKSDRYDQVINGDVCSVFFDTSVAPSSNVMYGMAFNNGGSPSAYFQGSVSLFINAPYLEECALATLSEAVIWLQTQIGRNV